MRVTEDKNGDPFGYCEDCAQQLRIGGDRHRVSRFVARHGIGAAKVTVTVTGAGKAEALKVTHAPAPVPATAPGKGQEQAEPVRPYPARVGHGAAIKNGGSAVGFFESLLNGVRE